LSDDEWTAHFSLPRSVAVSCLRELLATAESDPLVLPPTTVNPDDRIIALCLHIVLRRMTMESQQIHPRLGITRDSLHAVLDAWPETTMITASTHAAVFGCLEEVCHGPEWTDTEQMLLCSVQPKTEVIAQCEHLLSRWTLDADER
jgi:hypothetical protein